MAGSRRRGRVGEHGGWVVAVDQERRRGEGVDYKGGGRGGGGGPGGVWRSSRVGGRGVGGRRGRSKQAQNSRLSLVMLTH